MFMGCLFSVGAYYPDFVALCKHDCGTSARLTKNQIMWYLPWKLAKMMFPRLHYTAEHSQLLNSKYYRGTMTVIVPPSNFNDSHMLTQLQAHTQPESSFVQKERLEQASQCLETVHTRINDCKVPSGPQKLEYPIITQVSGLYQPCSWLPHCPLSILTMTLFQEIIVPTWTQQCC